MPSAPQPARSFRLKPVTSPSHQSLTQTFLLNLDRPCLHFETIFYLPDSAPPAPPLSAEEAAITEALLSGKCSHESP